MPSGIKEALSGKKSLKLVMRVLLVGFGVGYSWAGNNYLSG